MAVTTENIECFGYHRKLLFYENFSIIWPYEVHFNDHFKNKPLILYNTQSELYKQIFKKHFKKNQLLIKETIPDWDSIEKRVSLGLGWSIIPNNKIKNENNYNVVQKDLVKDIPFYIL